MLTDSSYAFLVASLIYLLIWVVFYVIHKDLRREMLTLSLLCLPLGLTEPLFTMDYWNPELIVGKTYGIEVFLFCFSMGGIAAVVYELVFRKHLSSKRIKKTHYPVFAIIIGVLVWSVIGVVALDLNSIYVSSIGLLSIGVVLLIFRKDLLADAVYSGLLFAFLMFTVYQLIIRLYPGIVSEVWYLENISSYLLVGVPVEELLWGFSWGFLAGPVYEEFKGYKFISS